MSDHVTGCCCPTCASAPEIDRDGEDAGRAGLTLRPSVLEGIDPPGGRSAAGAGLPDPAAEEGVALAAAGASRTQAAPALKPVYDQAEVIHALTTMDGTFASVAWGRNQISYSISTGKLWSGDPAYQTEHEGYVAMTAFMDARARAAFQLWDDLIAVELIEVQDNWNANIKFNYSTETSDLSYARYDYTFADNAPRSDYTITDAEIWMNASDPALDQDEDLAWWRLGTHTYVHEIGHALGITHPGQYNISANFLDDATHYQDTRQYTVMSYFDAEENGSGVVHVDGASRAFGGTPLLHDILAAQAVYGADMTTRTGDTTYGFNSTAGREVFDFTVNIRPVVAIWDAGGQDWIDVSGFAQDQMVDLREGAFSSVGPLTENLAIAYGAVIEHATLGAGNDTVIGNAVTNLIRAGAGDDTVSAGAGNDIVYGNAGADLLDGGDGSDSLRYNTAGAAVAVDMAAGTGTAGEALGDVILNFEDLQGSAYGDTLRGSAFDNRIDGNGGADLIEGQSGHDFLLGGAGDDTISGGFGNDLLRGGAGADRLDGGTALDWAQYNTSPGSNVIDLVNGGSLGEADGDTFIDVENVLGGDYDDTIRGDDVRNQMFGGAGNDLIEGREGNDVLRGDAGVDTVRGGVGHDTLDGGAGGDLIEGGDGQDWVYYEDSTAGVTVDLLAGTADGGWATGDTLSSIEYLRGSAHDDRLTGDDAVNIIRGLAGADTIDSAGGNDVLTGGAGADTFVFDAGDGVDRLHDFERGLDVLHIASGATSFAELSITDFRGDAAVGYAAGSTILLTGIAAASLEESDFSFA